MDIRAIEAGSVSLARQLVKSDLKAGQPCGRPGCVLDTVSGGGAGGPHNLPSVLYKGTCNLCGEAEVKSEYWGETGRSALQRFLKHEEEVRKRHPGNAFAKHLALHHPEHQGDITKFNITVISSFKKPLTRKKSEAVMIRNSEADFIMNSKDEFKQPALHRITRTRENQELRPPGHRGRGAGARGGRRGGGAGVRESGGRGRGRGRGVPD